MLSLEEISDRLEIQQLLVDYSTAIDTRRFDDLEATLTEVRRLAPERANDVLRLRAKAAANLRLFDAARAGVAAAQTRLDAIRQAAGGLSTYDRAGQRRTTPTAQPRHERRT